MSKITLYCHRKVNSIKGICGYQGTYHPWNHIIYGGIPTDFCHDNCLTKVCQDEADKCKYYDCRWLKNEDRDTLCVMCWEKMGFQDICEVCLSTRSKKENTQMWRRWGKPNSVWHLLMDLKKNYLLKKLSKWANKKCKTFNIHNVVFLKKIKKNYWRYHYFTPVYQKSWWYDLQFLR